MLTSLPEILDLPDKLLPMIEDFDKYRYVILEGGRGGGKSQSVVRFILFLADKYKLRVVCAREQQVNITESVYSIFSDLILKHQLAFDVQSTKINGQLKLDGINFVQPGSVETIATRAYLLDSSWLFPNWVTFIKPWPGSPQDIKVIKITK